MQVELLLSSFINSSTIYLYLAKVHPIRPAKSYFAVRENCELALFRQEKGAKVNAFISKAQFFSCHSTMLFNRMNSYVEITANLLI